MRRIFLVVMHTCGTIELVIESGILLLLEYIGCAQLKENGQIHGFRGTPKAIVLPSASPPRRESTPSNTHPK